mmetsp:Transcript_53889/g.149657  ORF Transcript_53889/g.149657 Transcript_53889/m.149657 type:complete len:648 (-) Transcript_53889:273-2216(-)
MQLKVVLPSGEVNVPVEPNSTPGHLKENLKYSIRVPPKLIKLTCEGRELDDIKPLVAEPNNLQDGAIIIAEAREGVPEEPARSPASPKAPPQPTMIKKEEPPKPKKLKREDVRPTVASGDVVKGRVLQAGRQAWKPEYLEGKQAKRHLAFMRLEAVEESKSYPEHGEDALPICLGDPQTSPVWTAAAVQMKLGEKAQFTLPKKAIDFDPEGLNPTDSCATWNIELLTIVDVVDVQQDFSQLLHIENAGGKERAEDLDSISVHWRMRRWMAEGCPCIASSRERIAILPGYGLVPIEDTNAPPVAVSMGEGQQEAVECIAARCGPGGRGHLYLKSEAMKSNRPQGCVVLDVEVVAMDACRGPGSAGWRGWQSLVAERETGDQWLEEADQRRKQLETFGTLRKSTGDSKDAEAHVSDQVHKFANNAARRYRRALKWLEADDQQDKKNQLEKSTVQIRLAKASTLAHQRFGDAAENEAGADEKAAVQEALVLLKEVLTNAESSKNEQLTYECLKMTLQVWIQGEDVDEARKVLERLMATRPDDEQLKSDSARINRLESALNLKKGACTIESVQKDLQAAIAASDKPKVSECVASLFDMIKGGQVTWDTVRTLKVGKDVGNAMKMGDADIAASARKVVGEIQALAQRAGIGL